WYALGYIVSLVLGWLIASRLVRRDSLWGDVPRPSAPSLDDLLVYVAFGAVLGGRAFYVLFYNLSYFLAHPLEIPALCGLLFARREKLAFLSVGDLICSVAPIGLFLVRLANFIKPELWGRPTD